jgi:cobalt-zinc-cadmium efflux system protein
VTQARRLSLVLALNLAMIAGLIIVGLTAHSLGVLAAGGDYVLDSGAILLGLLAVLIRDHTRRRTNITSWVALINASLLLGGSVLVIAESVRRLTSHHPEVHGLPVLVVSLIAAAVMVLATLILTAGDDHGDLHMRSVVLDGMSDAATAGAVALTGGLICLWPGLSWLDSAVALIVAVIVAWQAGKLWRDTYTVLHRL